MPSHNTANPLAASPTKLKNGAWGATTKGPAVVGDVVRITTQSGKTWEALVTSIVWSGDGKCIVATESLDRPRSDTNHDGSQHAGAYRYTGGARRSGPTGARRASGWTGCSCGSIEGRPRSSDCKSCQHDY